jgi:ankyrin repeat protein
MSKVHAILGSGAKLDVRDNYGTTPLLQAVRSGLPDLALELLDSGANPNFRGDGGDGPLRVAAWYCDLRTAAKLLELKADVNGANWNGENALMAASQTCLDGKMLKLLISAGADLNAATKTGGTPLMIAAESGNRTGAEMLIRGGADIAAKDKVGQTAKDRACARNDRNHAAICDLIRDLYRTKS